ncbi:MAG: isochorismatase family cysteine hydrolase [Caldisericota bacterium]|nr:isochorismatase family cysteine hydrolase [Caldisericota bacterium]
MEDKREDATTPTYRKFLNPNFEVHSDGDYWEKFKPLKDKTALLIIDVQKHDQDLAVELRDAGNSYLYDRLRGTVIPNARRLLTFFRDQQMAVTFATLGNQREDGRDRSPTQARPGWNYTLLKIGSREQEVVDELKPRDGEVVVCKTTDSTVMGTQYGHILRWMGIEHVVVCGLFTDQCVSSTVRDLSDWGYTVFLVEDATSAINADLQVWETRMLNQIYCKVVSTDEVLQDLATQ